MLRCTVIRPLSIPAIAFLVGACTDTPGNPLGEDAFDPEATSTELQPVASVFGTDALASLAVLGAEFAPPAAGAAAAGHALIAAATDAPGSFAERTRAATQQMALNLSPTATAELIPEQFRGLTFVYVPGEGYLPDQELTGAPETGVRFLLYAVNPVTEDIVVPLVPIGHADVIDESTETSLSVRLVVVSGDVTYLNYAVTATGVLNAPVFTIEGFVTDGTERADFTLTNAIQVTFAGTTIDVDYAIDMVNRDVHIDVSANLVATEAGGTLTVEGEIRHGPNTVTFDGNVGIDDEDTGVLQINANGSPFATVTITDTGITAVGPDGEPLSQRQIDALEDILDVIGETFEAFEDLLDPVEWLFPGD